MRYIRDASNQNVIVGIFLLIVLAVFAGPNAFPRFISSLVPIADEGVPCGRLPQATDRARHQSLIGRSASSVPGNPPVTVRVQAAALPADTTGEWLIRITLINDTIGTIPVIINETAAIGDTGQNGLGVVFNAAAIGAGGQVPPASSIRLLGPRQRCVQRLSIPGTQLGTLGAFTSVKAYYRSTNPGAPTSLIGTPIYGDQGLWTGVIESELQAIILSPGT